MILYLSLIFLFNILKLQINFLFKYFILYFFITNNFYSFFLLFFYAIYICIYLKNTLSLNLLNCQFSVITFYSFILLIVFMSIFFFCFLLLRFSFNPLEFSIYFILLLPLLFFNLTLLLYCS